ncbi:MAG: tetratricopeptide repeat protein [Gemmatimonadetes bacterium]|nr:tetratricopeptide repeat protein [Gemmatimonadota bacterium]
MAPVSEVLKKARELEKKGDWDRAAQEYKSLQSHEHPPPLAFNLLGDLYHKKGDEEEAYVWYEKAIEMYAEEGLFANAIGICRKTLRQDRERLDILEKLADLFHQQGLAREAVNHHLLYAATMAKRGAVDSVIASAERIRSIMPEDPKVREKMGDLLQSVEAERDAMIEFAAAETGYRNRGDEEDANRLAEVLGDFSHDVAAETAEPESPEDFPGMQNMNLDIDEPATPAADDTESDTPTADYEIDTAATLEGPAAESDAAGDDSALDIPEDHVFEIDESAASDLPADMGMPDADETEQPETHASHYPQDDENDFVPMSEILREFQEGVEQILDEHDYQSHYDMGMSYKEMGLYEEALREFQAAAPSPEHHQACLEMQAAVLLELSRYDEAIEVVEDLLTSDLAESENEASGHYLLGMAYERKGESDLALNEYRRVEELDPHFGNVRERIAQVNK